MAVGLPVAERLLEKRAHRIGILEEPEQTLPPDLFGGQPFQFAHAGVGVEEISVHTDHRALHRTVLDGSEERLESAVSCAIRGRALAG